MSVTIIPDVLKAVCSSISLEHHPFVESLTNTAKKDLDPEEASTIQEEEMNSPLLLII